MSNRMAIYDLIILQEYFARKKEPTEREKAAAEKLDRELLAFVEGLQRVGPVGSL